MLVTLQGVHNEAEAIARVQEIFKLFKKRYQIKQFGEIHFEFTLLDEAGMEVELVDQETNTPYRHLKVCEHQPPSLDSTQAPLRLIIDNT